jgi:hypothetical protein
MKSIQLVCIIALLNGYLCSRNDKLEIFEKRRQIAEYEEPIRIDDKTPTKTTYNPRKQEIRDFMAIYKNKTNNWATSTRNGFDRKQIKKLIGSGSHLVVFSCEKPGYLDMRRKTRFKDPKILLELNKTAICKSPEKRLDRGLWLEGGDENSLVTYDYQKITLSRPRLPMNRLIQYFSEIDLCDDFMKFMRHPGYFVRNFPKPAQCKVL